jgi:hypothetical protein
VPDLVTWPFRKKTKAKKISVAKNKETKKEKVDHPSCLLQPIGEKTSPLAPVASSHLLWPSKSCGTEEKSPDEEQLLQKKVKKPCQQLSFDETKLVPACSKDNAGMGKVSKILLAKAVLQVLLLVFHFTSKLWLNWKTLCQQLSAFANFPRDSFFSIQQKPKIQPLQNLSKPDILSSMLKGVEVLDVQMQDGIQYQYAVVKFELGERGQPCILISKRPLTESQLFGGKTMDEEVTTRPSVDVRPAQGGVWKSSCDLASCQ